MSHLSQWDLVCSRKGMNKLTATIFFISVMVGAPSFGFLSKGELVGVDYVLLASVGADLIQLDSFHLIVGVKSVLSGL